MAKDEEKSGSKTGRHEAKPVHDPVDEKTYPRRTDEEAEKGVRHIVIHDPESRAQHVAKLDEAGNEMPLKKGEIADVHDYVEGDLAPAGYIAPVYEDAEA